MPTDQSFEFIRFASAAMLRISDWVLCTLQMVQFVSLDQHEHLAPDFASASHAEGRWFDPSRDHKVRVFSGVDAQHPHNIGGRNCSVDPSHKRPGRAEKHPGGLPLLPATAVFGVCCCDQVWYGSSDASIAVSRKPFRSSIRLTVGLTSWCLIAGPITTSTRAA